MATTITSTFRVGTTDDIIITGTVDWESGAVEAKGWNSALTGKSNSQKLAYCKAVLEEKNPQVTTTDLNISG